MSLFARLIRGFGPVRTGRPVAVSEFMDSARDSIDLYASVLTAVDSVVVLRPLVEYIRPEWHEPRCGGEADMS